MSDGASLQHGPFKFFCTHCKAESGQPCTMPSGQIVRKERNTGWAVHTARWIVHYQDCERRAR